LVKVQFETAGVYVITLSDMSGKTLLRQNVADQTVSIDLSNYAAGVYIITIDDGKRQTAKRIIKN